MIQWIQTVIMAASVIGAIAVAIWKGWTNSKYALIDWNKTSIKLK